MKKIKVSMMSCLVLISIAIISNAQETVTKPAPAQSYKAGGIAVAIPSPATNMTDVGFGNRKFMEVFVPPDNRLIAGFLLTNDLPKLGKTSDGSILSKYAIVEVARHMEYMDCSSSDFGKLTAAMKKQFGDVVNSTTKKVEEEFNRRMKSLDLNKLTVKLEKPVQLGCLFSKQDAYGFGMIMFVSSGGTATKMGVGSALVRVKQRVLFLYLYAEYKNEDTVKWLRRATEDWADAVLKANK